MLLLSTLGACESEPLEPFEWASPAGPAVELPTRAVAECVDDAECVGLGGGPCSVGECLEGQCVSTPLTDGIACDDGNACTTVDLCTDGACVGVSNVCSCVEDADCAEFDDANACTGVLVCVAGSCTLDSTGPVVCPPPEGCLVSECDPVSGSCVAKVLGDGAACEDGDLCTVGETCEAGSCFGGKPRDCEPEGTCSSSVCDPALGCVFEPLPDGTLCTDGNPCSDGDKCQAGACVSGPNACSCGEDEDCIPYQLDKCAAPMVCIGLLCEPSLSPGVLCEQPEDPCLASNCQPSTGECVIGPRPEGAACGSAPCSDGASCQGGECVVIPGSCDDGNPCAVGQCDPVEGCVYTPLAGTCDDGDPCTEGTACEDGECLGGALICDCVADADCVGEAFDPCLGDWVCTDGFCAALPDTAVSCDGLVVGPCEVATCQADTGTCVALPSEDGAPCDDGNPCSWSTTCSAGVCGDGEPISCDDSNPCTNDSCVPGVGCENQPNAAPCDDGDACTGVDTCKNGGCHGGAPVDCPDGGPCAEGVCEPGTGCGTKPLAMGTPCDDGSVCTKEDVCSDGMCGGTPICECEDDGGCPDDGDPCNGFDVCQGGFCVVSPGSVPECPAGTDCSVSACDPAAGGCVSSAVPDGTPCDDAGPCTQGGQCSDGSCVAPPVACDDGKPCTEDACDPATGLCTHGPVGGNPPCDDGDPCTLGDVCSGGLCAGSMPLDCSDGDACTLDACTPGVGCELLPDPCDDLDACTVDSCVPGVGCKHTPTSCPDGEGPCEVAACDASTGDCSIATAADGTPCGATSEDGCTVDLCQAGLCETSTLTCADDDPCTMDSCAGDGTCSFLAVEPGTPCDDGLPCTAGDACDAAGACVGDAGDTCDDGDGCTVDACGTGGCENVAIDCDDGELCTIDTCSDGACAYLTIAGCSDPVPCDGNAGSACDDGDGDTIADLCLHGICRGFTVGGVPGSAVVGHVVYSRVARQGDTWHLALEGYDGPLGDGGTLATLGADGLPIPAAETVSTEQYVALGPGAAAASDGALWLHDSGSGTWSDSGTLQDAFAAIGSMAPHALWTTDDVSATGRYDLWVGGASSQQVAIRRCTHDPTVGLFGCSTESVDGADGGFQVRGLAGHVACTDGECLAEELVAAGFRKTTQGKFVNDIFELGDPYAPGASWTMALDAAEVAEERTRGAAALGDGRFLVVGTAGHIRHRKGSGNWSGPIQPFADQSERVFEAVWSGAGIAAVVGWRPSGGGERTLELWVLRLDAPSPASPVAWIVYNLGQTSGDLSGLFDVDGTATGVLRIVGSTQDEDGYAGGLVLTRQPQ